MTQRRQRKPYCNSWFGTPTPYSLDLAPSDFYLFPSLKKNLAGRCFGERRTWTTEWNAIWFPDEFRFYLQHHNGQIRVWRHHSERLVNCIATLILDPVSWFGDGIDFTVVTSSTDCRYTKQPALHL
ncbi:hypothetical protein TNCV_1150721 [Trichonephila clavipes]|nr:hypothetical protein TNCV_1150721 [Trichonephila clavipes]